MRGPALALLLTLSGQVGEPREPGPRKAVEGIGSLSIESEIRYAGTTTAETFRAVYVFPDRGRWDFSQKTEQGAVRGRTLRRWGTHGWVLERNGALRELEPEETSHLLRSMELRRALFLYPLGFRWEGDGNTRTAPLPRSSAPGAPSLGRLRARIDAETGRVVEMAVEDGEREQERLVVSSWNSEAPAGGAFPRGLVLRTPAGRVWTEEVKRVRRNERFLEAFFHPRPASERGTVMRGPLVAMTYRRVALPAGIGWEEARRRAGEVLKAIQAELGEGGAAVDPRPTFELTPQARPAAVLVRLRDGERPPPPGWEHRPAGEGALLVVAHLEDLSPLHLKRLASLLPPGAPTSAPWVRILPSGSPGEAQLALAIAPPR